MASLNQNRPPNPREVREFFRPGSLRFKALVAVVMVVIAPAVWVWSTTLLDRGRVMFERIDLRTAAAKARVQLEKGHLKAEEVASSRNLRLRVLDGHTVTFDADHEGSPRWYHAFSDPFFGPEGRPDPHAWDARRPPLHLRPEVVQARTEGRGQHCSPNDRGNLLVCAEARSVQTEQGTRVVHVQRSRGQAVRSLYDDRFQIAQLTLYALIGAVLTTFWLGTRWVRPLESLRDQALERTQDGLSTDPLVSERHDEFGQVTDAFNTLLAALQARNGSNERFAADLAHELKNPIAAVQTAASALEPGKPLTEARAARLHRILVDSSERMAVVMDRFLQLARAEAGLSDTERSEVVLHELIDNLLGAMRADERFAGVAFERTGVGPTRSIAPERMETAFRNLLSNAASFALESAERRVSVRFDGDALHVEDSGPGISPEDLPRIFDRYFTKRQGGTGLGLPLSRAIIEAHGGSLTASSTATGAVFSVRFS